MKLTLLFLWIKYQITKLNKYWFFLFLCALWISREFPEKVEFLEFHHMAPHQRKSRTIRTPQNTRRAPDLANQQQATTRNNNQAPAAKASLRICCASRRRRRIWFFPSSDLWATRRLSNRRPTLQPTTTPEERNFFHSGFPTFFLPLTRNTLSSLSSHGVHRERERAKLLPRRSHGLLELLMHKRKRVTARSEEVNEGWWS